MDKPTSIFFIDDDQKAGRSWLRHFQDTSYSCSVFSDAQEALQEFACRGAELIVTDLCMPGMKGAELLKGIRTIDTEVPVIIVTASEDVDSVIESLRLGATDFIKKPCAPVTLVSQWHGFGRSRRLFRDIARTIDQHLNNGEMYGPRESLNRYIAWCWENDDPTQVIGFNPA